MRPYVFIGLLAIFFTAWGCREGQAQIEVLQKETEDIHDEAMKDLASMNRVNRSLRQAVAGIDSVSADQAPRRAAMLEVLSNMKKAEEEMFAWMSGYEPPVNLPGDEAQRYLMVQKQKIEQNHRAIQEATAAGEKLLKQE